MNHINIAETYRTQQNNAKPCRTLVRLEEPEKNEQEDWELYKQMIIATHPVLRGLLSKDGFPSEALLIDDTSSNNNVLISFEEESSVNLKHKHSTAVIKILFQRKLQNQFGFYICSKFSVFKSRIWALDSNPDREVFTSQ